MSRAWDDGDDSLPDGERTKDTDAAFDVALKATTGVPFAWCIVGSELRLSFPAYVAVIRGQSSATGHGKHGSHPARIAEYREIDRPVWLCYVESGGDVYYSGWLHALPEAHPISTVVGAERYGWNARKDPAAHDAELIRGEGLSFPDASEIPAPEPSLFGGI